MGVSLVFQPRLVEFTPEERDAWVSGDRGDCDDYCAGISGGVGIGGFGEYITGKHWETREYRWVHHDFDIFGYNIDGKYPSQTILETALGAERLAAFKRLCKGLEPFKESGHDALVQPDLLIYNADMTDIRFAECKRHGTSDLVSPQQALGLYLIESQLGLPAEVCVVAERGTCVEPSPPLTFTYERGRVRIVG